MVSYVSVSCFLPSFQESMSSAETPNNNKKISLSNSFNNEDQGYHGGIPEQDGRLLTLWTLDQFISVSKTVMTPVP